MKNLLLIFSVLLSTSLSAVVLTYDPNQLISNLNGSLYSADPSWTYPNGEWPTVQNGGLTLVTDIASSLSNNNSFSFEIEGLSYGSGTFNELNTKLQNNEVEFHFNVNGQEYSTLDEDLSIGVSSWGTESATYSLDENGLSLSFVHNSIFEIYGEYSFFHTAYYSNDGIFELFITSGGNYNGFAVDETNPPINFTTFYSTVPEPSTYALILGALVLGFVAFRRK